MPGPVALLGGLEHHEPMLPLDRRVLDEVGVFAPEVVIVPVASFRRQAAAAGSLAQRHWSGLGASTRVILPGSGCDEAALDALSIADVIVLPGGVPNRLMRALDGTPILRMIIDRWEAGAGITGSSAGAIGLFERRLNLYPPSPFRLIPGLGLLSGYVAAPHFDRLRVARWFRPIVERLDVGVIGLDESTGLVGHDGSMMVMGAGSVTIATRSGVDVWPNGATIDLALTRAVHGTVPTNGVHPALDSAQAPTTSANSGRVMAPLVSNVS
jgi:cyanophycinase-like exopeptidase